jgi:DNA repair exonuclease SbcCD ATPase subunit
VKIKDSLKSQEKEWSKQATTFTNNRTALQSNIDFLKDFAAVQTRKSEAWQVQHDADIDRAIKAHDQFEANRKKIVSKKCNSCGTILAQPKEVIDDSRNPYIDRLENLCSQKNPYSAEAKDCSAEVTTHEGKLKEIEVHLLNTQEKLADIEQLLVVTDTYRSVSINNTISYVETQTNRFLMENFDAEIQVKFEVESADKLDVQIFRGENLASFTQLSKGQRQLLKLCFGISVMQAVQNHHGVKFHQIFIDEATDGLDEQMKGKVFKLLETLTREYGDVFLVEHSESLKNLFTNKYTVELVNGESQINRN